MEEIPQFYSTRFYSMSAQILNSLDKEKGLTASMVNNENMAIYKTW